MTVGVLLFFKKKDLQFVLQREFVATISHCIIIVAGTFYRGNLQCLVAGKHARNECLQLREKKGKKEIFEGNKFLIIFYKFLKIIEEG